MNREAAKQATVEWARLVLILGGAFGILAGVDALIGRPWDVIVTIGLFASSAWVLLYRIRTRS